MIKYTEIYWNELRETVKRFPLIQELRGKKILVTGCTGLICSTIVDILICANETAGANIQLFLAGRNQQKTEKRFYQFINREYMNFVLYDSMKPVIFGFSVEYIIHGASNAYPEKYLKEPVETLLGNVIGVSELLNYAYKCKAERFLYISSSEVYGIKSELRPYREDDYGIVDILNPRACYPSGKRAAETLCASYAQEYGVDTVIVRPGHIYGPAISDSDNRASAEFTRNAAQGRDIVMKSSGAQLRSYCYTIDCATATLTVLLKGKKGEAYNISNSNSIISIREFAQIMAHSAGCSVKFENASSAEKSSYNLMENSSLNSEKLEELGWRGQYDIYRGIKSTLLLIRGDIKQNDERN